MSVRLGNYNSVCEMEKIAMENAIKAKREHISTLLEKVLPFVKDIRDIYDTYFYLKDNDTKNDGFVSGLWSYLCRNNGSLSMSSYFTYQNNNEYHFSPIISINGIAVFYDAEKGYLMTNNPDLDCNKHDKNVWRGKYSFERFLNENFIPLDVLDKYVESLEVLIINFPIVRDKFFNMVSNRVIYKK